MQESYRVLLVDDEEDILEITRKSLERYGHVANTFLSSTEAFQHFREHPNDYDVLVTDVRMPGMRGYELAQEVKKINPAIKVFLMSAYEVWQNAPSGDPAPQIDEFLQKPFDRHVLCMTLRKHLAKSK